MKLILSAFVFGLIGSVSCNATQAQVPSPTALRAFSRVATFPVYLNSSIERKSVAEIITASSDGMTLIYADSIANELGFIDIADPASPQAAGTLELPGEPTSIGVIGDFALACVNTSANFVNASGVLVVVNVKSREVVRTIDLGGQPDSVGISPDKQFAVIAIENERNEDFDDGRMPQAPGGFMQIVDCEGAPAEWKLRQVSFEGLRMLHPTDAEPEYVDINARGMAVITLQENNHVVLLDVATGAVVGDFACGAVDLKSIDTKKNGLVQLSSNLNGVLREPDAVTWIGDDAFATANEGDMDGGSRGFTIWNQSGDVLFDAGSTLEHAAVRHGHYPEGRAGKKGVETEGVDFGIFGSERLLFVGSERASMVQVYEVSDPAAPKLRQFLPTGVGPEGLLAIPSRNLFVVAAEKDDRNEGFRSCVTIFQRAETSNYPTIISGRDETRELPIAWGALSGLSALALRDRTDNQAYGAEGLKRLQASDDAEVFAVQDDAFKRSRFFTWDTVEIDGYSRPFEMIQRATMIIDTNGKLKSALEQLKSSLPKSATADFDIDALVTKGGPVNLDFEGICAMPDSTLWLASEGKGNLKSSVSDPDKHTFESPNLLVHISRTGQILEAVLLPNDLTQNQSRFGFEGITHQDGALYICFQRAWKNAGSNKRMAPIGRYDLTAKTWSFAQYPLSKPTSENGGWTALSEITAAAPGEFIVIERDNQGGRDATIKHIAAFTTADTTFTSNPDPASFPTLKKTLVHDLIKSSIYQNLGAPIPVRIEGLCILPTGELLVVNDNNATKDSYAETLLIKLPKP